MSQIHPFFAGPVAAILLFVASVSGQGIGLEDLIKLGLEKNRDLAVQRQELVTASFDTLNSATAVNPHLEVAALHNLDDRDRPTAGIRLSKEFRPGIRNRMKGASKAEWEARQEWLRSGEKDLIEGIRTAYYDWQILDRKAALQKEVIERWERLAKLASAQVAQGRISEVDQIEARLNAAKARQNELALLAEREAKQGEIQVLVGQSVVPAPLAKERLDTLPALPPSDTLATLAAGGNPVLLAIKLELEANRRRSLLEEGAAFSGFNLSVGYEREAEGFQLVGAGIEVPIPLFNRNQTGISKSRSALKETELRYASAEARLKSELVILHGRLSGLSEQYRHYQAGIRELIRKQLSLSEKGYREGLIGIFDLSRVQAEYLAQEEFALGILEQYYRGWNHLDKLIGGRK